MTLGVREVCPITRSASMGWHSVERPAKVLRASLAQDSATCHENASSEEEGLKAPKVSTSGMISIETKRLQEAYEADAKAQPRPPVQKVASNAGAVASSEATSLQGTFEREFPDKTEFIPAWLEALTDPSVCIASIEDVVRIDMEDVEELPVPPLVKNLFRKLIRSHLDEIDEQQAVLKATATRAQEFLAPLKDRNMQPPTSGSKYFQDQKNYRLILTNEEIQAGVRIAAHRIETWCKGERICLVGILKGAFVFMSDLCRALVRPYSVYFVEASSYKDGRVQSGMVVSSDIVPSKFVDAETNSPIKIVLVDELLDNGKTMQDMKLHILENLKGSHTENDILTACLFSKDRKRECPEADVTGIPNLPDLWLIGYGLDDRGTKRGWTELFAVPKVKIAGSLDEAEVRKLLDKLDDDAVLTAPHVFNGFELSYSSSQKYRVSGLDVHGTHHRSSLRLQDEETRVGSKDDILRCLAGVQVFKGKYEHELLFAFIQSDAALVAEDEIFYGNNQVYAHLRCRLRRSIEASSRRCGLPGLESIERTAGNVGI